MSEEVNVIFGKGEYALTSKNIDKVIKSLEDYNASNRWQWKLQDVIGIHPDGKLGKRFGEIKATLASNPTDANIKLLTLMETLIPKTEVIRVFKAAKVVEVPSPAGEAV